MKKYLTLIFSAIMIAGLGIGLAACGPHEHNITWTIVTDPTCTQEGLKTGVCDGCDEQFSEAIEKLPHTPQTIQEQVDPKCEEIGYTAEIKCSVCGEVLQKREEIAATGHKYGQWEVIDEATCEHGGQEVQECEVEGCGHANTRYTNPLPHEWGQFTPDEQNPGFHKHVCENCQFEESFSCVFSPEQHILPTCTTDGERFEVCSTCGYKAVIEVLQATGHETIYVPEDVSSEGSQHTHQHYLKCTKCDEYPKELEDCTDWRVEETIAATCTTAEYQIKICNVCGVKHEERMGEAKGHDWTYTHKMNFPFSSHLRKCNNCDVEEVVDCSLSVERQQQDCTHEASTTYSCSLCEYTTTIKEGYPALGHDYREDWVFCGTPEEPKHMRTCHRQGCGEQQILDCQPELVENLPPTCVKPGSTQTACRVCLHVISGSSFEALGHNWSEEWIRDGDQHYHECQTCHQKEYKPHDFDEIFEPSKYCDTNDKTKYTCKECDYSYEVEKQGSTKPHIWEVTKIEDGRHVARCMECQKEVDGAHDWSESNICSICQYDGLEYNVVSEHAIVTKSPRLNVNTKNIIINPLHKVLDGKGGYELTEYRVTEIASNAFANYDNIEHVVLPYTLEKINRGAFNECSFLQDVQLLSDEKNPPSLKRIEEMAFYHCDSLQTFNPPNTLVYIGNYAFAYCSSLYEITIPDKEVVDGEEALEIEPNAFLNTQFTQDSKNWKDDMLYIGKHLIKVRNTQQEDGSYTNTIVEVAKGTLTIAANAFDGCKEIQKVILPAELKHIDADAFLGCEKLSQVEFKGDIYQWLSITFVNDYSSPLYYGNAGLHVANVGKDGVVDLTNQDVVKHVITHIPSGTFRGTDLKEIILPDTLISIGEEAFEDCTELTTITFVGDASNLAYVGKDVLKGCTKYINNPENWDAEGQVLYMGDKVLVEAKTTLAGAYTIKEGTVVIVAEAFRGCTELTSVNINASLKYVGDLAFDGCSSLQAVNFDDTSYVWLCTQVKNGFSRSLSGATLNWGYLQNYKYSWKRLYKSNKQG